MPGGVQFEAITIQMRTGERHRDADRTFVLPLAVTIFVFILISNWLVVPPVQYTDKHGHTTELLKSAADINYVGAGAFVFVCYHTAGIWRGITGHLIKLLKGHVASRRSTLSKKSLPIPLPDFSATFSPAACRTDRALPLHHVGAQCDLKALTCLPMQSRPSFLAADNFVLSAAMELEEEHLLSTGCW